MQLGDVTCTPGMVKASNRISIDDFFSVKIWTVILVILLGIFLSFLSIYIAAVTALGAVIVGGFLCIQCFNGYYISYIEEKAGKLEIRSDNVVLVVGGARGLGLLLVKRFLEGTSCKVCVIDIRAIDGLEGWYKSQTGLANFADRFYSYVSDVSDAALFLSRIKDVEISVGKITVLVNCVGINHSALLSKTNYSSMRKVLDVNLISYLLAMRIVMGLRAKESLYIVNVASVLGMVSPANLSLYSASKAAIISVHESVSHEIRQLKQNIRMLLVNLGQLDTVLFENVQPPREFLAPVLSHKNVSGAIFRRISSGVGGEMVMPMYGRYLGLLRVVPFFVADILRWASKVDESVKEKEGSGGDEEKTIDEHFQEVLGEDVYREWNLVSKSDT